MTFTTTASSNRARAALAITALRSDGVANYCRPGSSQSITAKYLDSVPEADVERGLALLKQRGNLPAWAATARTPSPLERRALRDGRICKAIMSGVPISEAIESTLRDEALRDEVRRAGEVRDDSAEDSETRRRFDRDDIRREIAEHEKFLADSRAGRNAKYQGPSIDVAIAKHDPRDRSAENKELWTVAVHEAGHAIAICAMGLDVESVIVHRPGNGWCDMTDESARRATPEQRAILFAAGTEGAYAFGLVDTTRLQDHRDGCDGPQFAKALGETSYRPTERASDPALNAICHTQGIVHDHAQAVNGLAKVLYDNCGSAVPGDTAHGIYQFFRGDFDESLDEQATEAALRGEEWNLARGQAMGLR